MSEEKNIQDLSDKELADLYAYINSAREIAFYDYPKLPPGIKWGAKVGGLIFLADEKEEGLFMDIIMRDEYLPFLQSDKENLAALAKLAAEQYQISQGLLATYAAMAEILKIYSA